MRTIFDAFPPEYKGDTPLLNYIEAVSQSEIFQNYRQKSKKERMMFLAKNSPEIMGIVRPVSIDIVGKHHFEPVNENSNGRNRVKRATAFSEAQNYIKTRRNTVNDLLLVGEGFNFKSMIEQEKFKTLQEAVGEGVSSEITRLRKLRYIASTTMVTNHDDINVTGYTQYVGTGTKGEREYTTDEIIKLSFEELDGKVEGFTPLFTLPLHIELLYLFWLNQYNLQKKGNHPDLIVQATGIEANHPEYAKIKKELQAYNMPGRPNHGTMFLTGRRDSKLDVKQLTKDATLQFREVGEYVTSLIAQQWQLPASRLTIKTQQAAGQKDPTGSSDRSYWKQIEAYQDYIAQVYNNSLWIPFFGVKMVHDKSYLHDEVQENQAEMGRLGNLKTKMEILRTFKKGLKIESVLNVMNGKHEEITQSDLEDIEIETPEVANNIGSVSDVKSPGQQEMAAEKRTIEMRREAITGKPSGV